MGAESRSGGTLQLRRYGSVGLCARQLEGLQLMRMPLGLMPLNASPEEPPTKQAPHA